MIIQGKAGLITGAAGGIGRAIAVALAERGLRHLTICDIDSTGLTETAALVSELGTAVTKRQLDVADLPDLERALEGANDCEGLDIAINNAGIVAGLPEYPQMPLERIATLMSINLTAVTLGTAVAARIMAARGGGVIINTASTTAFRPRLLDAPYRASKAGVIMLTQCCKELAASGVRVNAVAPGITDTPILNKLGNGAGTPSWLAEAMDAVHILTAEEVAAAFVSLIEDESKAGEVIALENELKVSTSNHGRT